MGIKSKYGSHIDFPENVTFHEIILADIKHNALHKPNKPAMVVLAFIK